MFSYISMAPNVSVPTEVLYEYGREVTAKNVSVECVELEKRKYQLVWRNIIGMTYLHLGALYGIYLTFTSASVYTVLFGLSIALLGGFGITGGAHRLWAHKSYKAKWQLRLFLMFCNTLAFQDAVIDWARDHRLHHKYSETDADPHNAKRGFFFSHVGWLMCRKHPQVKEKGKGIDMSDLSSDPILAFQKKHYIILMTLICFVLPVFIPMHFWNETFVNAWYVNVLRYVALLNGTWSVNSAAHLWGTKPYDRFINPSENLTVAIITMGEGWHNFHHTFPWDYKTSELGKYSTNFTTGFIDLMAKIGWAYDLKTVSVDMIRKRVKRSGDGSHNIWGWGDKDQSEEEREEVIIINRTDC